MPRPPRPHSKLADDVKVETDLVPSLREAEASARAFREQEVDSIQVDDEISQFSNPQCKAKRRAPVLPAPGEVSFGEWVKLGTSPMNAKVLSPIAQCPGRSKEAAQGKPRSRQRKRAAADVREPETAAVSKQRRGSCAVKPGMAIRGGGATGGKPPPDVPERMEEPTFAPAEGPPQDLQAPSGPSNLQPVPSEMPQEEEEEKNNTAAVVDKGSFGTHAPSYPAARTTKPEAPLGPWKHAVKERTEEHAAPCSGPVTAVLSLQQQERVHSLIQVSEAAQWLAAERVAMQMARQRHAQAEEAYRAALQQEKKHRSDLGLGNREPLPPPAPRADRTDESLKADAVGRAMTDPSARAKAVPEEATIPAPAAPADVEISSAGEDTDDDMAWAAQKDRSSTEEPFTEANDLATRSLTESPSHERKPCRRGALRHRSTTDLRIREKKAEAVDAAPAAVPERRACSRADVAAGDSVGEATSGSSNARQALQKLFQSMQKDKPKSGSSSESTSKLSETRKALCKLYESMQKRSSSS